MLVLQYQGIIGVLISSKKQKLIRLLGNMTMLP